MTPDQVTNGGGETFGWSPDGRQRLFGRSSDPIHGIEADVLEGNEFGLGPARLAFTVPRELGGLLAAHDGRRFLVLFPAGTDPTPSITLIVGGLPSTRNK